MIRPAQMVDSMRVPSPNLALLDLLRDELITDGYSIDSSLVLWK